MTDYEPNTAQRQRFSRVLIEQLDTEPFQPQYKRKPFGSSVVGLPARLENYFWPDPDTDYARTQTLLEPLWSEAGELALALQADGGWSPRQQKDAVDLALKILK